MLIINFLYDICYDAAFVDTSKSAIFLGFFLKKLPFYAVFSIKMNTFALDKTSLNKRSAFLTTREIGRFIKI